MYPNPNAYLGANNQRPGQQQYGGSFPGPAGQQQQQQYTGYPGLQPPQPSAPLQQQYTGFSQNPVQQSFQTGAPPMPSMPPQFQQQFQQQQQHQPQQQQQQQQPKPFAAAPPQQPAAQTLAPPPPPMKTQATGFSQMAASFHTGGSGAAKPKAAKKSAMIPNDRLPFITAQDQAKFESVFKSAVGEGQITMSGEKARDLLLRSRLDGDSLSHIWLVVPVQGGWERSQWLTLYIGHWPTRQGRVSFTSPSSPSPCTSVT